MSRIRTLAPTLGLTAIVASSLAAMHPVQAQTVTVTPLQTVNLPGFSFSFAEALSGNRPVGYGYGDATGIGSDGFPNRHALLWKASADSAVDLNPAGFIYSEANGASSKTQVGVGYGDATGNEGHALLWKGTADSVVDLNPTNLAGFYNSTANGASENSQVGVGDIIGSLGFPDARALLWHGTADSAVDLTPADLDPAYAYAATDTTQVGGGFLSTGKFHAVLWHGTADSVVDLNPAGFDRSQARGVSGNTQVGSGELFVPPFDLPTHALLWHGTAGSAVDLNPAGFAYSEAVAASGNAQVGDGNRPIGLAHALLWRGTAESVIDLHAFLPAGYNISSAALGVSGSGNAYDVVGYGSGESGVQSFSWHLVFSGAGEPVINHLYPASRTVGRDGFTLTVAGSGFTAASQIVWNGAVQTTTFVSGTTLTASIPASLIATAGTAQITVLTDGAFSNVHNETIMPRPVFSGLAPANAKAGSGAFTLIVYGFYFRPASFYSPTVVKWNGTTLATTYISETMMTAQVPAALVAHSGTARVAVTTPQVATTESKIFAITP